MTSSATLTNAPSSRRRAQVFGLLSIAIVVLAIDQLSKNWVVANLPEGESVPIIGNVLEWHFVRNPGAAFSFASGATWVFTILAAVVVVVLLWQVRRLGSRLWAVFFALLLGGVLGNLTDRLTRDPGFPVGHVIDFISTPWMIPAIYNFADIAIVVAMILFALLALFGVPIDGSPRERASQKSVDVDGVDDAADADDADDAETTDAVEGEDEAELSDAKTESTNAAEGRPQ